MAGTEAYGAPRCGWAHRRRGAAEHGAGRGRHVGVAGAWGPGLKPRALRLAQIDDDVLPDGVYGYDVEWIANIGWYHAF